MAREQKVKAPGRMVCDRQAHQRPPATPAGPTPVLLFQTLLCGAPGGFVVIALDENWRPGAVTSGLDSLRVFDLPEDQSKHLISASRKYYYGLQE